MKHKRFLSLIMALAMSICLFPTQVFASSVTTLSESEIDGFFLSYGASQNSVDALSTEEKIDLFNSTEETPNISEDILNSFFESIGTSEETISEMDYTVKLTVYESLQSVDPEIVNFVDYTVELASAEQSMVSPYTVSARGLSDWLEFSTTVIYAGGNLNRYYIYPSFEWVAGGTVLSSDAFSFALHSNYWDVISEQNLKVYYLDGTLRYETAPTTVGFSARSYNMRSCISNDVIIPYKGTGCLIVRPNNTTLDDRIIFNYAQNFSGLVPLNIGVGIFSIQVTGFDRQYGKEDRFDI